MIGDRGIRILHANRSDAAYGTAYTIVSVSHLPDKRIVDALMQANIPRQQIVLAYAGEPVKDSSVA